MNLNQSLNLNPSLKTALEQFECISLGVDCSLKMFIQTCIKSNPQFPFDYCGTPMWAIVQLIKSQFENFTTTHGSTNINKILNIRFVHDAVGKNFICKYNRRICRFNQAISSPDTPLVFFRKEEIMQNPNYPHYNIPELEYVKQFSECLKTEYLKTKGNLKFYIFFFTKNHATHYLEDYNIFVIQFTNDIKYINCVKQYSILLNQHMELIESILTTG